MPLSRKRSLSPKEVQGKAQQEAQGEVQNQ